MTAARTTIKLNITAAIFQLAFTKIAPVIKQKKKKRHAKSSCTVWLTAHDLAV